MLLVDIEVPKDCSECPMRHTEQNMGIHLVGCRAKEEKWWAITNDGEFREIFRDSYPTGGRRPKWCPITSEVREALDGELRRVKRWDCSL